MKIYGTELNALVNRLSDEIRQRYPNLYFSMSEFHVRQTLEDIYCDTDNHHIHSTTSGNSHLEKSAEYILTRSKRFRLWNNNGSN